MYEIILGTSVWFRPGSHTGADFLAGRNVDLDCCKIYAGFIAGITDRMDEVNLMVLDHRGKSHLIEAVKIVEQSDCIADSRTCSLTADARWLREANS